MRSRSFLVLTVAGSLTALSACSSADGRQLPGPGPDQTASIAVTDSAVPTTAGPAAADDGLDPVVTDGTDAAADSSAAEDDSVHGDDGTGFVVSAPWAEAGQIPVEYGCQGEDISPPLSWSGVPEGTVELAVVMTDLDADNFVHWVAFGIDPGLVELPAGQLPEGVAQATNSFGNLGYGGPCPPTGSHTYLLEVYAVSQQLEIADGTPAADALTAIQSASLAVATVLGLYPGGE